jgi:hypothetical protein
VHATSCAVTRTVLWLLHLRAISLGRKSTYNANPMVPLVLPHQQGWWKRLTVRLLKCLKPLVLIALLLIWRTHGGLVLACAMWVMAFLYMRVLPPRLKSLTVAWLAVFFGMLCNATVTVANDGFMPVRGFPLGFKPLFPIWIPAGPADRLTVLADQHALSYYSIGDMFIISGVLLWCVGPSLLRLLTRAQMRRSQLSPGRNC